MAVALLFPILALFVWFPFAAATWALPLSACPLHSPPIMQEHRARPRS